MNKIICITGPTAAGKSAAVMKLAESLNIEIINMDSATIYKGMDIGTAKPNIAEQKKVPQHLLNILDPAESYSAADFCNDSLELISAIQSRQAIPILAGGTMMYYKALREGLHELPNSDPEIRQQLEQRLAAEGLSTLYDQLVAVDPITAKRLKPNDSQRIQRALEVYLSSGKPLSDFLKAPLKPKHNFKFLTISLEPTDRSLLHQAIEVRFYKMLEAGFLDEVQKLKARTDLHADLPSIRCVGYRQLWAYLEGKISYKEAIEQGIAATRQLAKRQITWLRSQPERLIIDCFAKDKATQVHQLVKDVLN